MRTFQYKVLNSILYTNDKLYKIGFSQSNKCTFCKSDLESLYHLLYICPLSRNFWADFESFWSSISKEEIHLSLQDVILGITTRRAPYLTTFFLLPKYTYGIAEGIRPLQILSVLRIKLKLNTKQNSILQGIRVIWNFWKRNGWTFVLAKTKTS